MNAVVGISLYSYVDSNPLSFSDPMGLQSTSGLTNAQQRRYAICMERDLKTCTIGTAAGCAILCGAATSRGGVLAGILTGGIDVVPTPDGHVAVGWLVIGNAYFSESLLFWTRYSKMALPSFTHCIAEAICFGLELELPLRGAIAVGEAILDTDSGVYLGAPLVEVARTERSQQWIGASFGPSFSKPGFNDGFYLNTILPYKSQYKDRTSEFATGMAVDWPRRWREGRKSNPLPVLKALDRDPDFSAYYNCAARFIDFSKVNHL